MTTHLPHTPLRPGGNDLSGQARAHARELACRLTAQGLRASGEPHRGSPSGAMAVSAQRVDVRPYAGRLVVLLPGPRDQGELYWHWPRLYRGHEHTGACWFQPFSPAAAYDDAVDRISAVIDADVRRRGEGDGPAQAPLVRPDGEAGLRLVLDSIGQPLHKLVYRQLEVLDELQRKVEDPALLRGLYGIDHLGMRTLRGLERIAVLAGVRARELPEPLLLARVLREAASQVKNFPRVRIPPPRMDVSLPGDVAPEVGLLLAELVENATQFSPHDTDVLVTVTPGEETPASGLRIEIADRGQLPIPQDQLAALNRLLAAPGSVDLAEQIVAGPIGLLVVATVAKRHGMRVELHPRPGDGIRAVVELPEALLMEPPPPLMPAAPAPARVISGVLEFVVSQAPLPHRPEPPSETGPSATETARSAEPAAGPPLPHRGGAPRRAGAHRAVGARTTEGPTSATTGADVGAVAAFLQGVHDPAAHRSTDQAADQAVVDPPPGTAPEPPPDPATT